MINIKAITEVNGNGDSVRYPERELTAEEQLTVFAQHGNENEYIYFQNGDEETPEYMAYLEELNRPSEPEPQTGAALAAILNATPEELEMIKNLLK